MLASRPHGRPPATGSGPPASPSPDAAAVGLAVAATGLQPPHLVPDVRKAPLGFRRSMLYLSRIGVSHAALGICAATASILGVLMLAHVYAVRLGLPSATTSTDQRVFTWYGATFGITLTVTFGAAAKALTTTSVRKSHMATRLMLHFLPICIVILACAADAVFVPRGPGGHRINVASLLAWSATSWSMSELFEWFALYSAGVEPGPMVHAHTLNVAALSLLRESVAAAPRLLPTPAFVATCSAVVAGLFVFSTYLKLQRMRPYFVNAVAGSTDRHMMIATLLAIFVVMAAVDVSSLAYAAGLASYVTVESVVCVGITVRALGLFSRLLIVMMAADERALFQSALKEEKIRMREAHEAAMQRVYRYVFHELRVPLNSLVLGLQLLAPSPSSASLQLPPPSAPPAPPSGTPRASTARAASTGSDPVAVMDAAAGAGAAAGFPPPGGAAIPDAIRYGSYRSPSRVGIPGGSHASVPSGSSSSYIAAGDVIPMMQQAADAMMTVLSDLLDLSRMQGEAFTIAMQPVDLFQLLRTAVFSMQPFAAAQRVALTGDVCPGVPRWVLGDRTRLLQAITNYMSNAIKYSPAGSGIVKVTLHVGSSNRQEASAAQAAGAVLVGEEAEALLADSSAVEVARDVRHLSTVLAPRGVRTTLSVGSPMPTMSPLAAVLRDTEAPAAAATVGGTTGDPIAADADIAADAATSPHLVPPSRRLAVAALRSALATQAQPRGHPEDAASGGFDVTADSAANSTPSGLDAFRERHHPQQRQQSPQAGELVRIRLVCRDNGCGIPPADLPRLFQPFTQLDGGRAVYKGRGTGLGLAIVREIVDRHGGVVGATSRVGMGSSFLWEIPFRTCNPPQPAGGAGPMSDSSSETAWPPAIAPPVVQAGFIGNSAALSPASRQTATTPIHAALSVTASDDESVMPQESIAISGGAGGGGAYNGKTYLLHRLHSTHAQSDLTTTDARAIPVDVLGAVLSPSSDVEAGARPSPAHVVTESAAVDSGAAHSAPTSGQRPAVVVVSAAASHSVENHASSVLSSSRNQCGGDRCADVGCGDRGCPAGGCATPTAILPATATPSAARSSNALLTASTGAGLGVAVAEVARSPRRSAPAALLPAMPAAVPPARPAPTSLAPAPPRDAARSGPAAEPQPRPLHVLVVDDERSNRRLLARLLQRCLGAAAVFHESDDGAAALSAVDQHGCDYYDIILMDHLMPQMNGRDATAALREMGVTALIIGCTGSTLEDE